MMRGRVAKLIFATALVGMLTLLAAGPAGAQTAKEAVDTLGIQMNLLWVVIGAVLVIFMQAGFALVETGFCRAKHAAHVVSTNFAIFGLGFVAYYLVGYGLMFGGYSLPLIGMDRPVGTNLLGSGDWVFLWQGGWAGSGKAFYTAGGMAFFLYMVAFMDTVATIPTGAMAERWKVSADATRPRVPTGSSVLRSGIPSTPRSRPGACSRCSPRAGCSWLPAAATASSSCSSRSNGAALRSSRSSPDEGRARARPQPEEKS